MHTYIGTHRILLGTLNTTNFLQSTELLNCHHCQPKPSRVYEFLHRSHTFVTMTSPPRINASYISTIKHGGSHVHFNCSHTFLQISTKNQYYLEAQELTTKCLSATYSVWLVPTEFLTANIVPHQCSLVAIISVHSISSYTL